MGKPKKPKDGSTDAQALAALIAAEEKHAQALAAVQQDIKPIVLVEDDTVFEALTDEQRAVLTDAALRDLSTIALTQGETRDQDGKLRDAMQTAQVIALRLHGYSPADTAQIMGIPASRVHSLLQRVRRDADLDLQAARLDKIGVSLAVDNVIRGLITGDKDYTLEMARGRGLFKTHQSVKEEKVVTQFTFSIEAKLPAHLEGKPLPQIKAGAIVGSPSPPPEDRVVEAEVVEAEVPDAVQV